MLERFAILAALAALAAGAPPASAQEACPADFSRSDAPLTCACEEWRPGRIWGTDVYTNDSHICTAAVHAGLIDPGEGGVVTLEPRPGQDAYAGSERHGVRSRRYGRWGGAFAFVSAGPLPQARTRTGPPGAFDGPWHGYLYCAAQPVYFQARLEHAQDAVSGTLLIAPMHENFAVSGPLPLTGSTPRAGAVAFEVLPQAADGRRRRPDLRMVGRYAGTLEPGVERIAGTLETLEPSCETFEAWRIDHGPQNPEGLLFQDPAALGHDACAGLARLLAPDALRSGPDAERCRLRPRSRDCEALKRRASPMFHAAGRLLTSRALDQERLRQVLGKDLAGWGRTDHVTFRSIASRCKDLFERQPRHGEDVALAAAVRAAGGWSPTPFSSPKGHGFIEAAMHALLNPPEGAGAPSPDTAPGGPVLAEIAALPARLESLAKADALIREASPLYGAATNPRLEAARRQLASRIARDIIADYPAVSTVEDLWSLELVHSQRHQRALEAREADLAAELQAHFTEAAAQHARRLWPQVIDDAFRLLHELEDADFARWPDIQAAMETLRRLGRHAAPDASSAERIGRWREARDRLARRMIARSERELADWIATLPLNEEGAGRLEAFTRRHLGASTIPPRYPLLAEAQSAFRDRLNPAGFSRPGFLVPLLAGQWGAVDHRGLENLSYAVTLLGTLREACPNLVPGETDPASAPLKRYAMEGSMDGVRRLMRGEMNQRDAFRGLLALGQAMRRTPGCYLDYLGNPVGCVSRQDYEATREAIVTSPEGRSDAMILLARGCEDPVTRSVVENFIAFARMDPFASDPHLELVEPWEYVATAR